MRYVSVPDSQELNHLLPNALGASIKYNFFVYVLHAGYIGTKQPRLVNKVYELMIPVGEGDPEGDTRVDTLYIG